MSRDVPEPTASDGAGPYGTDPLGGLPTLPGGLAALTGHRDGPPVAPAPQVVHTLDALAADVAREAAGLGADLAPSWLPLLTGRAALRGLHRQGQTSPNGTCRLLRATDGWLALNLARPDDVAAVPALVGHRVDGDRWVALAAAAARQPAAGTVAEARLLGMAAALLAPAPSTAVPPAWTAIRLWPAVEPRRLESLRVLDLSAMWAGPLAARLLGAAGAAVTKVESPARPDGVRGDPPFFDWLHPPGHALRTLTLSDPTGRRQLLGLLAEADVVIEASRPRALEQLGLDARAVPPRPGRVWVAVTGYGRSLPGRDWVAFGDDAAVAGGLVARDHAGEPVFLGDAVADPVTGLVATLATLRAVRAGGGVLLDVSMAGAAAVVAAGATWPGGAARAKDTEDRDPPQAMGRRAGDGAAGGKWVAGEHRTPSAGAP